MEKLLPLNHLQWIDTDGKINRALIPLLNQIASLLKHFVKHDFTPAKFNIDTLMLNREYHLKVLKPLDKDAFNFQAIEDFIIACSNGQQPIVDYLREKSGINTHPVSKFYQEIQRLSQANQEFDINSLASIYKISDPQIIRKGDSYHRDAEKTKILLNTR